MAGLNQSLTVTRGTAVMLNIVLGAGLLALPGLAIEQSGDHAFYAWLLCGLVALPLLFLFISLGRKYPDAGGIAHFTKMAFGNAGYGAASLVFLGAIIFGLPSIALTGGHYANVLWSLSPHIAALTIIIAAMFIQLMSSELAAKANTFLAAVIVLTIVTVIILGFLFIGNADAGAGIAPVQNLQIHPIILPFMMLFFAFTGWEVAAGLAEEFRDPKRDFPLAMLLSFVITICLYGALAYLAAQVALNGNYEVAFSVIAKSALGPIGETTLSALAVIIILANLSGAIWAVSRLIFALSREGFLPPIFQESQSGAPRWAVVLVSFCLCAVVVADWQGLLGLSKMLALAGQNFFILYCFAAVSLLKFTDQLLLKLLSVFTIILVLSFVAVQGSLALYPIALTLIGIMIGINKSSRQGCINERDSER